MATGTSEKTDQVALTEEQRAWLSRFLGGKVPWSVKVQREGIEVDAREAYEELQRFDEDLRKGEEFEGMILLEMEELRKTLQRVGMPSVAEKSAEFTETRGKKDEELKKLRELLELQKKEIAEATDYKVKVKRGTIPLVTKTVSSKKGGQAEKEYSEEHYKGRVVQGPTPEQAKALKFVITQLELLTENLRSNEELHFSPNELMDEIWTPLVREQIISEHQCPSEFSRVIQLWQGASKLYNERCKEKAREEEQPFESVRGVLADVDEVLGIGAAMTDVVLTALGTGAKSKEILKLVSKCARAGVQLTSNLLAKDFEACSGNIGTVLEAAIPEPFGKVSKGAFLAAANAGLIAQKLSERDNNGAADLLGKAVSAAFTAIGAGTGNDLFERLGGHIEKGISNAVRGKQVITLLQADPVDTKAVLDVIGQMVKTETQRAVGEIVKETKHKKETEDLEKELEANKDLTDEQKEEAKKDLESQQEEESETHDQLAEPIEAITAQFTTVLQQQGLFGKQPDAEAIEQAAVKNAADETNAQLDQAQALFTKQLGIAFNVGVGADDEDAAIISDLYDIDKLLAQIESDRAQLELLSTLLDAIGGVVALLVPQLGGIVKAKQFAMNVVAAVRRSQELITFTGLLNDAKKATSPQAHSLLAQVDELRNQLTDDVISAALHLGQGIAITAAAACELSGIGAAGTAAGRGVAAALEGLEQAKDFLLRKFKERKVKRAWQRYRAALDNPEDRIAIIKAIRSNPTLAKYAVAYGALEMGDPFAKEALRQCGLNDMVLAQEKTNADKVVRYLEVKFADDIQVVGVVTKFAPDSGDPLTFTSWAKNKAAAQTGDGKTMLDATPTNNIDGAFGAVDQSAAAVDEADIADAADYSLWETHRDNLLKLQTALLAFQPKTTTGVPFEQFQDYLKEMAFAVGNEAKRMEREIAEEKAVREQSAKIYQVTVEQVNKAVLAIDMLANEVGTPPKSLTPAAAVTLCSSGGANKLLAEIKSCAKESPSLKDVADLVVQAIQFTTRRANMAVKAEQQGEDPATQLTTALTTLVQEVSSAKVRFQTIGTQAQESIDRLTVV
ncbi:MAG: hypothetical protein U0935_08720 [Pirellulales bacterium]